MQSVYPRIEDVVVIAAFLSHTLTAAELELCVLFKYPAKVRPSGLFAFIL